MSVGGFLDRLEPADREALEAVTTRRRFAKGDVVFLRGQAAGDVFIIVKGQIKLTLAASDGREVLIEIRGPGEIIGEMALIDESRRSASGFALGSPTEALVVPVREFSRLVDSNFGITRRLLDEMVRKVRDTTFHQLEYGLDNVSGRVSRRIDELAKRFGDPRADGSIAFRSPITQQELADWAGVSRQAVVNELASMREAGWIETKGSNMLLLDPAAIGRQAAELDGER